LKGESWLSRDWGKRHQEQPGGKQEERFYKLSVESDVGRRDRERDPRGAT